MKIMKRKDFGEIMFSVFLLLLSVFALIYINSGKETTISGAQSFDFATVPTIWALVLGVLVIIHLVITVTKNKQVESCASSQETQKTPNERDKVVRLRTLFTFLTLVAYVFLLGKINFFILSVGFLFTMFYVLGQRKILVNTIVSLVGGVLLHLILIVGLQLPL